MLKYSTKQLRKWLLEGVPINKCSAIYLFWSDLFASTVIHLISVHKLALQLRYNKAKFTIVI
jgi:hypothetical protein